MKYCFRSLEKGYIKDCLQVSNSPRFLSDLDHIIACIRGLVVYFNNINGDYNQLQIKSNDTNFQR